ncbi:monocarboxylate transporter 9-like [Littorina saxatilis]|uniref:Uncharacterized protein n=1 Tax=Littorina saxatilis TaxID=31220 RepID=A0AAN9GM68_9CAEN
MARSQKDSKDYSPVHFEPSSRDQTDKQAKGPVSAGTPRSIKLSSTSSSSSESSLVAFSDAFGMPPAPDGGWGWCVVFGAFMISLICDGCAFSFGVMFVHLVDEFQQSKSETAWIASIFYSLSLLLGPVAGALTARYGCRPVTIAAGVMSCIGFVASSFVTAVWQLYITFGVIVGCSFSVCYISSVLTVAYYFDKRRALATGLSVCGTGIGTFTFAPLVEYLVKLYGWRGTFLILGAITLNICVCGALMRPLTFTPEQRRQRHLTAFDRLTRPVSRLSIPSRNRSRLHSTNSESSTSSSSDTEDDVVALAYSQVELPTYIKPDKESIRMYLDKLPELRRSAVDPQLALQRFFKGKDIAQAQTHRSPELQGRESNGDGGPRVEYRKQSAAKPVEEDSSEQVSMSTGKRKKKKRSVRTREQADPNKALSDKSLQQLTEKLLENSVDSTSKPQKRHSHTQQNKVDGKFQSEEGPDRVLERTQSEKTPGKLLCKATPGGALERSLSEKLPAKLQCQGDPSSALEYIMSLRANADGHRKVTTAVTTVPSSAVDPPLPSGTTQDMGMMLMNKHSTYLILHRNDIFFRGSRAPAPEPVPCATSCPELSRLPSDSDSEDENCLVEECPCMEPVADFLEDTCDKRIIANPLFIMVSISNFLLYFWADVPYVFAADFAMSRGIPDHSATFLISIIGIVNTVGQVLYGLIGDQDWNLTVIYGISCIGSGLAVLLLPTAKEYWLMSVLCGLFGFFVSANYSLMTVMLVGYLGLERLANAYGLVMMVQGLANLGGPPLAGWIVDTSGNYDIAFPIAGGFIMLSGIIIFFLFIVRLCSRFFRLFRAPHSSPHRRHIVSTTLHVERKPEAQWVHPVDNACGSMV